MTERPILFSAPMVRALLAGTKTQTRRVVKGWPLEWLKPGMFTPEYVALPENGACPYGQPGDRLWVREAWTTHACFDHIRAGELTTRSLHYQADGRIQTGRNRAAMHMPRWASRITLEVTGVRVERLQDISEADAQAEGCALECMTPTGDDSGSAIHGPGGYMALWESINGPGSWDANPRVWVVEFRRAA